MYPPVQYLFIGTQLTEHLIPARPQDAAVGGDIFLYASFTYIRRMNEIDLRTIVIDKSGMVIEADDI